MMQKIKTDQNSPANPTSLKTGLTKQEYENAPKNITEDSSQKSTGKIICEHVFTFFNFLNVVIAFFIVLTGSYRNLMFMGVVISNTVIGLWQELHSRKILSRLAIISQAHFQVLRDSEIVTIASDEIALNDLLILEQGNQVPVDGVLVSGACQVNESALTGESDDIDKSVGDPITSGSFVTAGKCMMQVENVGERTFMYSIMQQAKRSRRFPSQLRDSLNQIIHFCTLFLIPTGILLFVKMYFFSHTTWQQAVLSSSASMIGMIPEGLVILTSVALFVSVSKLAMQDVLVQELYCIETLARVSTLCLDKTGTITTGNMKVDDLIPMSDMDKDQCIQSLGLLYHSLDDENATAKAIRAYAPAIKNGSKADNIFPFSSRTKFSGAVFGDTTWIAGAYSFVFEKEDPEVTKKINSYADHGKRVLVLARGPKLTKLEKGNYELIALIVIEDEIRPDAKRILEYFRSQDVNLKVISGDAPTTVAALAKRAGVSGKAVDMAVWAKGHPENQGLAELMEECNVFGRVTPEQKKAMVLALKEKGQTVAMTGDGVNDVLALKEADCSIAMGSGTQAARSVASVILLKDQFDALPSILLEGRRVINNIQRTASLFLVKTLFSFGLSMLTLFWLARYPFEPIQLTLVSFLGVGLPSFVLTLEPNHARVSGNFLLNVLSKAIPGALTVIFMVVLTALLQTPLRMDAQTFSTVCTWAAGFNALWVLFYISQPLSWMRKALIITMTVAFFLAMIFLPKLYSVVFLTLPQYLYVAAMGIAIPLILKGLFKLNWKKVLNSRIFTREGWKKG